MPRLFCRRGKKPNRFKSPPHQSEFVSASDWIHRTSSNSNTGSRNTNTNNNSTATNNHHPSSMDLHVNSTQEQQQHQHSLAQLQQQLPFATTNGTGTGTTSTATSSQKQQLQLLPVARQQPYPPSFLSPENVASVPPPGLSAPSQPMFITIPRSSGSGSNNNERIILSYVAVQPKSTVSYSSSSSSATTTSHKSRSSTGSSGIRSLYRPLTTSAASSNNTTTATTNVPQHHHPQQQHPNPSATAAAATITTTGSSNSPSHPAATERVLMCYDLTTEGSYDHSNSCRNDISRQHQDHQSSYPNSSQTTQPQQQSVPLLRWQSQLSSLLGRTTKANKQITTVIPTTTTAISSSVTMKVTQRRGVITDSSNTNNNSVISCTSNSCSSSGSNSTISNPTMMETTSTTATIPATPVPPPTPSITNVALDERIRRERLKIGPGSSGGSLTQFHWANVSTTTSAAAAPLSKKNSRNVVVADEVSDKHNNSVSSRAHLRLLIPARGSLYIQDGVDTNSNSKDSLSEDNDNKVRCICIHDKSVTGMSATDAQLSPDGSMVAWTHEGEIYVQSATPRTFDSSLLPNINTAALILDDSFLAAATSTTTPVIRISFGASQTEICCITHGVADFVAQEEMDRYRGFWWHPNSKAILFTRNDESEVPIYRIMHQSNSSTLPSFSSSQQQTDHSSSQHYESNSSCNGLFAVPKNNSNNSAFEDHRYPFAGKLNPSVKLGLVQIDCDSVLELANTTKSTLSSSDCLERRDGIDCDEEIGGDNDVDNYYDEIDNDPMNITTSQDIAADNWSNCIYFDAPREVDEYLARVHIIPDGRAIVQWQNRSQTCTILYLLDLNHPNVDSHTGNARGQILLVERSDVWINLHHMFHLLPRPIHPDECIHNDNSTVDNVLVPTMPNPLPSGSISFIFASEATGYAHLYLYTFCPGVNDNRAVLIRSLTSGKWTVENILGVDLEKDVLYFAGTYDSVLERHLYAIPVLNVRNEHTWRLGSNPTTVPLVTNETLAIQGHMLQSSLNPQLAMSEEPTRPVKSNGGVRNGLNKVMHALSGKVNNGTTGNNSSRVDQYDIFLTTGPESTVQSPTRLTSESGMHNVVMDEKCRYFVAISSDVDRPTTVKVYELPTTERMTVRCRDTIYDAAQDDSFTTSTNVTDEFKTNGIPDMVKCLPAPELISFPTSDGTETLHAALYRPNPHLYGPGPYPLVCAVYGGPHVQRVNRSWSQSADMRAQRLRSLGFCVVKCDNRGSSRRGLSFESAISRRLGRIEVLDQVAAVRQLVIRGIVDPRRVGVYGWSYGGYLAAMCLCRAPDVFHVAVAGAPVTSWDGYDTHYTERYMGLPTDNPSGYRESAVFDHVPNMRGKLMIVHGLIDENVHFRHTTRLINKLIAAGKDYDLLIFPEERHSPRRLRDRVYMEQRISEYFVRLLSFKDETTGTLFASTESTSVQGLRPMAGHL